MITSRTMMAIWTVCLAFIGYAIWVANF